MLTALALGARELASLPVPPPMVAPSRISFPSKRLPAAMHQKLMTEGPIQALLTDISHGAIEKAKDDATSKAPPSFTRERQLRLQKPAKLSVVLNHHSQHSHTASPGYGPQAARFTEVAAEYFICPLINQFWTFFRDEQVREERLSHQSDPLFRYRGSGTGLVLNPVVLAQFISTLAVLAHAGRNAPQWLALVAPDSLELAVTLGTRPVSQAEDEEEIDAVSKAEWGQAATSKDKEASVLAASLELALIILDGCLDLDGGRSLGLENTRLVLSVGEWAGNLLSWLEKGLRVAGGGGTQEVRLQRGAAGVMLKVQEVSERWGRSMIGI